MLALISRVWPGDMRMTVIALDQADHVEKTCYVWTDTDSGRVIANRCELAEANGMPANKRPIVLTVKPKHRYYGFEIEAAELLPTAPEAQP